ncbi:efflux RND transporter permease subunit, partial [Stenotrophomonas maltophilia]|uniref:efflux RND transporter permease subunit n=1 Tax=Stenotrophomonas maltophilia TaxID=40324 RepID=UPI00313F3B22
MRIEVFFMVGMISVLGLSAKIAILLVVFARLLQQLGRGLVDAAWEAARLRRRPILLTSWAFAVGVVPL